jgi:hypothetical protein
MLAKRMTPDAVMSEMVRPVKVTPVVVARTKDDTSAAVQCHNGQHGYEEIPEFHMFLLWVAAGQITCSILLYNNGDGVRNDAASAWYG